MPKTAELFADAVDHLALVAGEQRGEDHLELRVLVEQALLLPAESGCGK